MATPEHQRQHQERLMQLKMQQQQLELQLKQNKMMQAPAYQQQQFQRTSSSGDVKPKIQLQNQGQRPAGAVTGASSTSSLTRPPDLVKPPNSFLHSPSSKSAPSISGETSKAPSGQPANNIETSPTASAPGSPSKPSAVRRDASSQSSAPIVSTAQMKELLSQCDWTDQTIYLSKLVMGGASYNGFLRATATAQRIKKQRARQIKKQEQDEEELKRDAMNPRTAKKIRSELFLGMEFSKQLHETLKSILKELDPSVQVAPLQDAHPVAAGVESALYGVSTTTLVPASAPAATAPLPTTLLPASPSGTTSGTATAARVVSTKTASSKTAPKSAPKAAASKTAAAPAEKTTSTTTASPGDPNGSTLRRLRKRKFDPVPSPLLKKYSKKEQAWRLLELYRFRALRAGDHVAAKVSSRDLWILARVVEPYEAVGNFMALPESKRDAQPKVIIQDVEDSTSSTQSVARSLVLPLPRTFSEAADWGSRCRKGSRVYAMYPLTTSLYSGTVMDNTTYCRGDDDIIVVEFDGDEPDATGKLPNYHIPARFVTLIPKEFPAAKDLKKSSVGAMPTGSKRKRKDSDAALNSILDTMGDFNGQLGDGLGLDDDFDLGFDMK